MTDPKTAHGADEAPAKEEGWWETIKVVFQALLIAVVVRTLLFQPFNIPSGSLIPTLLIGDYLFVSKYSYGYSHFSLPGVLDPSPETQKGTRDIEFKLKFLPVTIWIPSVATVMETIGIPQPRMAGRIFEGIPKRGDIFVFRPPGQIGDDFIKRLIGLPGDKIQMIKGRLYINGIIVPREPVADYPTEDPMHRPVTVPHYLETLPDSSGRPNGVKHEIIQLAGDEGSASNTTVFEVPPGHYFMMGDNRDNSEDSRFPSGPVGYVPAENLIGRAEIVFFSVNEGASALEFWRWPWTVRWNRLFQRVH